MPKVLTGLAINRLRPPTTGRIIIWDSLVSGFGLRVTDKGAKSWVAMYRIKGQRKPIMQTLGSLKNIPEVGDARRVAREAIAAAHTGINPVEVRRAEEA